MKNRFHIPEGIYLLNHSVGCLPRGMEAKLDEFYFKPWRLQGSFAWQRWLDLIREFQQTMASLFSASSESFCPQANVSSAVCKVLYSLPRFKHKNTLLMSERDFPSIGFIFSQAKRAGFNIKMLPAEFPVCDPAAWDKELTDDVALVFMTHVISGDSQRVPVDTVVKFAKQKNIFSMVDVAQSAGIVPIRLHDWNADFVVGSCVKWLCGGPGAGYLWVHPDTLQQCDPMDVGWFSHTSPLEFDIHNFQLASDSRRFWGGTPSILPYVVASESIKVLLSIGVDVIQQHNQKLLGQLQEMALQKDITIVSPIHPDQRGGTLTLQFNNPKAIEQKLHEHQVYFDQRLAGLRFSPHIYNTEEEMQRLSELL